MKRVMMNKSMETVSPKGTVSSYREGLIFLVSDELAEEWGAGDPPTAEPVEEPEPEEEPEEEPVDLDY